MIYSKVKASTLSGSAAAVLMWVAREFFAMEIPPEVAAGIVVLVSAAAGYLKTEVVGRARVEREMTEEMLHDA